MKALSFCWCLCCFLSLALTTSAQDAAEIVEPSQGQNAINTLFWFGLLLFGCFLLAGKHAYTHIWQKRSLSAKDVQQLREMRQRLLRQVADLDEKYEAGRIDEQRYKQERAQRIQQLVELTVLRENV